METVPYQTGPSNLKIEATDLITTSCVIFNPMQATADNVGIKVLHSPIYRICLTSHHKVLHW